MTTVQTIDRLDHSKPPPGCTIDGRLWWETGFFPSTGCDEETAELALAVAWMHYKERHDPPGLSVVPSENERHPHFYVDHHSAVSIPNHATAERARTAAWAWYDARLALHNRLRSGLGDRLGRSDGLDFWPSILTWSNEQSTEVERWLVEDASSMPVVLRG